MRIKQEDLERLKEKGGDLRQRLADQQAALSDEPDDPGDPWLCGARINRPKPKNCPQCKSAKVLRIVYGLPDKPDPTPVEERDYVLGGCFLNEASPNWYCPECGHRWRQPPREQS